MRENEKKSKYIENESWSSQMELIIALYPFIPINWHQIYETQKKKI